MLYSGHPTALRMAKHYLFSFAISPSVVALTLQIVRAFVPFLSKQHLWRCVGRKAIKDYLFFIPFSNIRSSFCPSKTCVVIKHE